MKVDWPLIGRGDEVREIVDLVTPPRRRSVILAGPPGIGKSRLAAEVVTTLSRARTRTARVIATASARSIPLGAMSALAPVTVASAHSGDRAGLLTRCATEIARAGEGHLVLCVDDAHLLDDLSAALLHHLVVQGDAVLLATIRTTETVPDAIASLWKDRHAERIDLAGLDRSQIVDGLSVALGHPVAPGAAVELASHADGNMLYLRELVTGSMDSGVLRLDDGTWRLSDELRPSRRLIELIESRLADLSDEERRLLEAAAIGEPLGLPELAALDGLAVGERLERSGLLVSTSTDRIALRLSHPLYGDVLREQLPSLTHRALARTLADAVEASGSMGPEDTLRVASWRLIGGGGTAGLMLEAARAARWRYGFDLAARLVEASIRLERTFDAELLGARLAALRGNTSESENALHRLAHDAVTDRQRLEVATTRLDLQLVYFGTFDSGVEIADDAEASLSDTSLRDEVAAHRLTAVLAQLGPAAAVEAADALVARTSGRALIVSSLPAAYGLVRVGRLTDAIALAERAAGEHERLDEPFDWYPCMHQFDRGDALIAAGRITDACHLADAQLARAVEERSTEAQAVFAWLSYRAVAERGDVESAVDRGRTATQLFADLDRPQFEAFSAIHLVTAFAVGGRADEASAVLERYRDADDPTNQLTAVDWLVARGWVASAHGDIHAARALLLEAADLAERTGDRLGATTALHTVARFGDAGSIADRLAAAAASFEGQLVPARVAHARALADRDPVALDAVGAEFADMGAALLAAEAFAEAAQLWRSRSLPREAAASERHLAVSRAECVGARTPSLRIAHAAVALTPAERTCALLAASGQSNRQIADQLTLSVKTIENRLQRIYVKLGIASRRELAEALDPPRRS